MKFLLEHNRETEIKISSHPNIKKKHPQYLYRPSKALAINTLKLSLQNVYQPFYFFLSNLIIDTNLFLEF